MTPEDFARGRTVSRETLARLQILVSELERWNARINLVSRHSLADVWLRHVEDSAQIADHAPTGAASWLDLGSGGGFPGLVIAALRTDVKVTLVESDRRKAAFLRSAAHAMGIDVTVRAERIEAVQATPADVITARALAPLPKLLSLAARFATPETVLLFPKGARVRSELTEAATSWHYRIEQFPSVTDPEASILRISEVTPRNATP